MVLCRHGAFSHKGLEHQRIWVGMSRLGARPLQRLRDIDMGSMDMQEGGGWLRHGHVGYVNG